MAFGINTEASQGDGNFMPIVLFMAREGRFYLRDRIGGSNGYDNLDTELAPGSKMIPDFGSVEAGWLRFAPGMAPSFAVVPVGQPIPAAPDADHRQGIRLKVYCGKKAGIREFSNTAKVVLGSMDALHTLFENSPEAKAGKLPVITFDGSDPVTTENRHGVQRNFRPRFTVIGWVDRMAEFGERTVPPPGSKLPPQAAKAPQPAAKPARQAAPPPPPPPPPMVDPDDDWGLPPATPAPRANGGATPADPWAEQARTARPNGGSRGPAPTMESLEDAIPF